MKEKKARLFWNVCLLCYLLLIFSFFQETEVAREMTLIESMLYAKIQPKECLDQSWNKKGKDENAPAITRSIARFNEVCLCLFVFSLLAGAIICVCVCGGMSMVMCLDQS